MQFPLVRLNGLSSSHNPLDGLRVQPLNYVHKFQPHRETKKKVTTPGKHVLMPAMQKKMRPGQRPAVQH